MTTQDTGPSIPLRLGQIWPRRADAKVSESPAPDET